VKKRPVEQRFWENVEKSDRCWRWTGSVTNYGYGRISAGSRDSQRVWQAHRLSYWLHYGDYDRQLFVCHKCDNPICVRPDHLFLGTQFDNMRDCKNKGRAVWPESSGEKNGRAKLTVEQVSGIRSSLALGGTERGLAKIYGVSKGTIGFIKRGETWR
jgi:hypothetical protein